MATSSRLQMLGMFPQMILTSSSQSCLQTAQIIHSQFKEAILSINSDLVDGAPVIPSPDFNYNMEVNMIFGEGFYKIISFVRSIYKLKLIESF